ncbi:MAG: MFS transporter [Deltaproteobacteria bacterium]|nr:MFS transporter [Deltaproteobacteria bacterium]
MQSTSPAAMRNVLFAVIAVELVGFGIVVPVLPYWARTFGASGSELGYVLSAYALAQFLCAPLWGRLSDRIGRRPVMLLTIAGSACSLLLLGFANSLLWLGAARLLSGAFAANVSVATAYVADVCPEHERARWMGMIGASFALGFTLGPVIGGSFGMMGYPVPMFVAAGLSAANLIAAALLLREPRKAQVAQAAQGAGAQGAPHAGRFADLRDGAMLRICAVYLLFSLAVTQLESMFQLYVMDRFSWNVAQTAMLLFVMAIFMGGIQGGAMKHISARWSERGLVLWGALAMALGFALFPLPAGAALLLLPLLLLAAGRGVSQPSLMSLASLQAAAHRRGETLGAFQSSASLARIVGPTLGGKLYDHAAPGAPFWLAGALMLAVFAFSLRLPRGAGGAR